MRVIQRNFFLADVYHYFLSALHLEMVVGMLQAVIIIQATKRVARGVTGAALRDDFVVKSEGNHSTKSLSFSRHTYACTLGSKLRLQVRKVTSCKLWSYGQHDSDDTPQEMQN